MTPAYVAPASRSPRRRPLLVGVAAFAAVLAIFAAAIYAQADNSTTVSNSPIGEGWSALPDAPISARFQHLAVSTGTGLFVWGGYGSNDKSDGAYLDATTNTWRKLPSAPLDGDRGDAIGVWTGREVVVLNGVGPVRAAAFDPVAFTWHALPDAPLANAANAMNRAFFIDGAVIVVGVATEGEGLAPSQVARFDFATSQWTSGAKPTQSFASFFAATIAGDEIIVVADRPAVVKNCGSIVLAYRPASDSWRELPAGPATDRAQPVVAWTGSELFVGGGILCSNTRETSPSADLLDLATGTWRRAPDAPIALEGSSRYDEVWTGHAVATIDRNGTPLLFNPLTNNWHVGAPSRSEGKFDDTPFVWVDGSILIWSGGAIDGSMCCHPVDGGVAYTPPPGF